MFQPGETIADRYKVVRKIGAGGYAEVFEAHEGSTGARVALKALLPSFSEDDEALARFRREASITAKIKHPNVARTYGFASLPDGRPYMVMEYLQGRDLAEFLRTEVIAPAAAVEVVQQVAQGLAAAHALGFVHRDLKPENVFIDDRPQASDGTPVRFKVLDFGATRRSIGGTALTATGEAVGTPEYMSPEQATGAEAIDHRTDQFTLAVLAFELLTGRSPFAAPDLVGTLRKVVQEVPPAFASCGVNLPSTIEAVVAKALSKSPADRFPNVTAFAEALVAAAAPLGPPDLSCFVSRPPLTRKRLALLLWLAALCVATSAGCVWAVLALR